MDSPWGNADELGPNLEQRTWVRLLMVRANGGRTEGEPIDWVSHRDCNNLAHVRCGDLACNRLRMSQIRTFELGFGVLVDTNVRKRTVC